jgi:hypothetical protein
LFKEDMHHLDVHRNMTLIWNGVWASSGWSESHNNKPKMYMMQYKSRQRQQQQQQQQRQWIIYMEPVGSTDTTNSNWARILMK